MRTYGLIGYPLDHSFSKHHFTQKFANEGIDDTIYKNYPLGDLSELRSLIESEINLCGLNVTIPHKTKILHLLDEIDPLAELIGAVNTVRIERADGDPAKFVLTGYNTDVYGFRESLTPLLNSQHQEALILGTGGSSLEVKHVLNEMDIRFIQVSRKPQGDLQISYEGLDSLRVEQAKLIINTTPVGMYPEVDACPNISYEGITADHLVYDLIYNPEETILLKKSKTSGATTVNGMKMLELQAEKSWEIWNQ